MIFHRTIAHVPARYRRPVKRRWNRLFWLLALSAALGYLFHLYHP
jgi:hypothetical protein